MSHSSDRITPTFPFRSSATKPRKGLDDATSEHSTNCPATQQSTPIASQESIYGSQRIHSGRTPTNSSDELFASIDQQSPRSLQMTNRQLHRMLSNSLAENQSLKNRLSATPQSSGIRASRESFTVCKAGVAEVVPNRDNCDHNSLCSNSPPRVAGLPDEQSIPLSLPGQTPGVCPPRKGAKPKKAPMSAARGLGAVAAMLMKRVGGGSSDKTEEKPVVPAKPKHNRIPLSWAQTSGFPEGLQNAKGLEAVMKAAPLGDSLPWNSEPAALAKTLEMQARPRSVNPSSSIFTILIEDSSFDQLEEDQRLSEWFTRKKLDPVVKKTAAAVDTTIRASVLGAAGSKKYAIAMRCVAKAFDGWEGFKRSLLLCQMSREQVDVLLEVVPDPESVHTSRKLIEWKEAVAKVEQLREEKPLEPLYPDEEFVAYINSIPDLHQRLHCMLIMNSFDSLIARQQSDINTLMDAMEALLRNQKIPKLFKAILKVGNFLNEGTSLGGKSWFKLSTLKQVVELRGQGKHSLFPILIDHVGPIVSPADFSVIQKASQISVIQAVQNASRIHDVFNLLSCQPMNTGSLLSRKRRNSVMPGQDDVNDRFAEVGMQFVEAHKLEFVGMREDLRRLLQDYFDCVSFYGDPDSFLPIDKNVEDEKNPGQQRCVPDLFTVFFDFLSAYRFALKEFEEKAEKGKVATARREKKEEKKEEKKPLIDMKTSEVKVPDPVTREPELESKKKENSENSRPLKQEAPHTLAAPLVTHQSLESKMFAIPEIDELCATNDNQVQNRCRRASLRPALFPLPEGLQGGSTNKEIFLLGNLQSAKELVGEATPTAPKAFPSISTTLAPPIQRRRESVRAVADSLIQTKEKIEKAKEKEQGRDKVTPGVDFFRQQLKPRGAISKHVGVGKNVAGKTALAQVGLKPAGSFSKRGPLTPLREAPEEGTPPASPSNKKTPGRQTRPFGTPTQRPNFASSLNKPSNLK